MPLPRWLIPTTLAAGAVAVLWPTSVKATPRRATRPGEPFKREVYRPGSAKQIQLFERAASIAGVPKSWASDPAFINILKRESAGVVGIPNYQYGELKKNEQMWPKVWEDLRAGRLPEHSSATGLGQLTYSNVKAYYPSGPAGIGIAIEEAVGMLRYIKARYGDPQTAWEFWQAKHWY